MIKRLLLTLFLFTSFNVVLNAQLLYEVHLPTKDFIMVTAYDYDYKRGEETKQLRVENGEEVLVSRKESGGAIIHKDGVKYSMNRNLLYLSDKNPEGSVDYFADDDRCPNSIEFGDAAPFNWRTRDSIGEFLYSYKPHGAVVALLLIMALLAWIYKRSGESSGAKFLILTLLPILMLCVVSIEALCLVFMGQEIAWWIDPDSTGFFKSLLVCCLTTAVVMLQFGLFRLYKDIVGDGQRLSTKPLFFALLVPIPALIITAIIGAMAFPEFYNQHDDLINYVVLGVTFIGAIIYGVIRNISKIGFVRGLLFTLFSFVFAIGASIITVTLVFIVIKVLFIILIPIFIGILAIFVISSIPETRYVRRY